MPETENSYENLHANVYTCMDGTAPDKMSTEPKRSAGRRSLYRKALLVFFSLWLVTLITLIVGLILYYDQRSTIQRELVALKDSPSTQTGGTLQVAFTASLAGHTEKITLGPNANDVILVYKFVITNVGGAYNSSTGIFTVPMRGIYHFSFTAFGWSDKFPAGGALFLNHAFYMNAYDHKPGNGRGATNTIILQLEIGDILYIKLRANLQLHDNGNLYNTFSGHLLFPI